MLDFLILLTVFLIFWTWIQCDPWHWKKKGIPYLLPWPLVGNTMRAIYTPLHKFWHEKYEELGSHPYYGLHLFGYPTLVVKDPELTSKMLVTHGDHFLSHGLHCNDKCDTLARGLFFADGEQWRRTRQKMSPYFTPSRIKSVVRIVEPLAEEFSDLMVEEGKKPFEAIDVSLKYTTDVIVASTFGIKPDCMKNKNSFFNDLNKAFTVHFMLKILLSSLWTRLYNFFNFTIIPAYYDRKIKHFIYSAVSVRSQNKEEHQQDFLQGMIELMKKEKHEETTQYKEQFYDDGTRVAKFDEEGIVAQCMMLYAAGSDTTSATLASLLYELALNQEIQDKVRTELTEMMKTTATVELQHLMSLAYTNMVIDETLRKYSVLPMLPRKCIKPYNYDGIRLDPGNLVYFHLWGKTYDPKYFPEPEKFKPERFEVPDNITTGSYLPFGMGVRQCIGIKFARVVILMALCKLISKHRVLPSSRTAVPMQLSISTILAPKNQWLLIEPVD